MGGGGSLGGLRDPCTTTVRRSVVLAVTTVMIVAGIGTWAALDESVVGASTRRLAHQVPTPSPKPTRPVDDKNDDPFCATAFFGRSMGSLRDTTSAGPDGSTVLPGQQISVTLAWNPRDFGRRRPTIVENCVKVGSRISTSLSQDHRPGPSDGLDRFSYAMPSSGTDGQQVCSRGVVVSINPWGRWGEGGNRNGSGPSGSPYDSWQVETSPVLCYTILAAMAPEASQALLFPVIGLVVGGGAYALARHRRRGRARHAPRRTPA